MILRGAFILSESQLNIIQQISSKLNLNVVLVPQNRINDAVPFFSNLEKILHYSDGELTLDELLTRFHVNQWQLWMYPNGWLATSQWNKWVDIVCWSDTSDNGSSRIVMDWFAAYAKELGFRGIRFVSCRDLAAIERRSAPSGFKRRMVEYVREV